MFTKTTPVTQDPIAIRIRVTTCVSDLSPRDRNRAPARDESVFRKTGKSFFVDDASLRAVVLSLPPVRIGVSAKVQLTAMCAWRGLVMMVCGGSR
jgi:hypothetical protein